MTTDSLLKWRDEFPILQKCNYLINNSLGAMPRGVYDSLKHYADVWAEHGVSAWGVEWFDLNGKVGDKIAPLMGAPAGSVLVQQNASIANSIIFSAMDFSDTRRDKVVVTDMDFPSDYHVLSQWLPDHMRVEMIKTPDGILIDTDEILGAIDETTRLVSISHVLFKSAYIMPVKAIVEKAHQVGAEVVLNGYHSVGIIPVDVTDLNVDYYIGGVLKWMCGGTGGVFLYVRPDLLPKMNPKVTGWFSQKAPFAFDIDNFDRRDDIYRLATGTPGVASLQAIQPGIEIITQVGVANIREKSIRQTTLLIELADQKGYQVVSPRQTEFRGGTVTLNPPESYAVSREMLARNIKIDYRAGAGIRIAPHFYNTDEEVHEAINAIEAILADGSWKQHAQSQDFVT